MSNNTMSILLFLAITGISISALPIKMKITLDDEIKNSHFFDENGGDDSIVEGDIKIANTKGLRNRRELVQNENLLWDNGNVPYVLDSSINHVKKDGIFGAIDEIQRKTCVKFVPKEAHHKKFVNFVGNLNGCWSYVGKQTGFSSGQQLSVGDGCEWKGYIIHEMLHLLGMYHEHTRIDRDEYIKINWKNIQSIHTVDFQKHGSEYFHRNFPYDYSSIMHYGNYQFSNNIVKFKMTIVSKKDPNSYVGQLIEMSVIDAQQINALYCTASIPSTTTANIPKTTTTTTAVPKTTTISTTETPKATTTMTENLKTTTTTTSVSKTVSTSTTATPATTKQTTTTKIPKITTTSTTTPITTTGTSTMSTTASTSSTPTTKNPTTTTESSPQDCADIWIGCSAYKFYCNAALMKSYCCGTCSGINTDNA